MQFWLPRYVALFGFTLAMLAILTSRSPASEDTAASEQQENPTRSVTNKRPPTAMHNSSQVAVVNVDRLFKEHPRVRAAIEELKKQRESNQAELQKDADDIFRLERQLQQHEEESEKYQQLAEKIAVAEADLAAKRLKFNEEQERHEAGIYFEFHHEVTTTIRFLAQKHAIYLVVPFNSSEVSIEDSAEEVLHKMKSSPLYFNNIDLTDYVLQRIKLERLQRFQPGRPCCLPPNVQEPATQR